MSWLNNAHDEIYKRALELWLKDRNQASINNRAKQKDPNNIEFWRCHGLQKPVYFNVGAGLNALVIYYKECKKFGRKLNPNDYCPLESITPWNSSDNKVQNTEKVSGADIAAGILFGVTAVAGLIALGLALSGNFENNEEEQRPLCLDHWGQNYQRKKIPREFPFYWVLTLIISLLLYEVVCLFIYVYTA